MIWPFTKPVDRTVPEPAPHGFKWHAFDLKDRRSVRGRYVEVGSLELWPVTCAPVATSYHFSKCTIADHRRGCEPYGKESFDLVQRYDVRDASRRVLKKWRARMELEQARENLENMSERWNRQ